MTEFWRIRSLSCDGRRLGKVYSESFFATEQLAKTELERLVKAANQKEYIRGRQHAMFREDEVEELKGWCNWQYGLMMAVDRIVVPPTLEEIKMAEGRPYVHMCTSCGETNGGGIENEKHPAGRPHDPYSPINKPCLWCDGGPVVVEYCNECSDTPAQPQSTPSVQCLRCDRKFTLRSNREFLLEHGHCIICQRDLGP